MTTFEDMRTTARAKLALYLGAQMALTPDVQRDAVMLQIITAHGDELAITLGDLLALADVNVQLKGEP